jgi:lipopolysaccharide export system protein LptC
MNLTLILAVLLLSRLAWSLWQKRQQSAKAARATD